MAHSGLNKFTASKAIRNSYYPFKLDLNRCGGMIDYQIII